MGVEWGRGWGTRGGREWGCEGGEVVARWGGTRGGTIRAGVRVEDGFSAKVGMWRRRGPRRSRGSMHQQLRAQKLPRVKTRTLRVNSTLPFLCLQLASTMQDRRMHCQTHILLALLQLL